MELKAHRKKAIGRVRWCEVWVCCVCRSAPGFGRLRLHSKGGKPVAFVEFNDVKAASRAMSTLQGTFLLSSDRGAIRIEYAKTKMSEV